MTDRLIVGETRAAWIADDAVAAVDVTAADGLVRGDILHGRVTAIESRLNAAFVDLGNGRNGLLTAGEARLAGPARPIGHIVHEGESVLVQVEVPPRGDKAARLTRRVQIAGYRLALTPFETRLGLSKRLGPDRRAAIAALLPAGPGWLVRRHAEAAPDDALRAEAAALIADWTAIQAPDPAVMRWRAGGPAAALLRDGDRGPDAIVTADPAAHAAFHRWAQRYAPDLLSRTVRARADTDPFADAQVDAEIAAALEATVPLDGGGRMTIEETAALIAVDIDAGAIAANDPKALAAKVNQLAATALARQLRLRNLAGLIVVDLLKPADPQATGRAFAAAFRDDPATVRFGGLTRFGLFELTRERRGPTLRDQVTLA